MRFLAAFLLITHLAWSQESRDLIPPTVVSLDKSEIAGFDENSPAVQAVMEDGLALTRQNLGYKYGSASPSEGGMDCSGAIYYLLLKAGIKDPPRSSAAQYDWVVAQGTFRAVKGRKLEAAEFAELRPGDLLFWSGTYTIKRSNPITHAMIYLGKSTKDGLPLMVGSSDGRTYRGKKCFGVSVFEFRLPKEESKSKFVGYASIPGLGR